MANLNGFRPDEKAPEPSGGSFELLVSGHYLAILKESDVYPRDASKPGTMLKLVWEVAEGQYKGRTVWEWVWTAHPNETTMEIAHGQWNKIAHATGRLAAMDTRDYHNIPIWIKVVVDGEYNRVKDYVPRANQPKTESAPVAKNQAPTQTWDTPDDSIPF